jgi:hypothetical protein
MNTDARKAAASYMRRGASVIPIPTGRKKPGRDGWETLRLTPNDIPNYWTNGQGIGLLTGQPSGWLVDVDLDVEEAVQIAGRFLPQTLTSGRESRPHSHWWFRAEGAENREYKDTDGKKRLVELRSTGRQTLVAPSIHPSGEEYVWHTESGLEVARIAAEELEMRVRELTTATLIARHLPRIRDEQTGEGGGRHDYAMALSGFLLRPGRLDVATTHKILKAAWDAKGWPNERSKKEAHRDLEGIVEDTARDITDGEPVVGGPTLEGMEPGMINQLRKYWGWHREEEWKKQRRDKEEKATQSELLLRCANGAELFHTPAGDAYATIPVADHLETHPIKAKGFRRWLVREFYRNYGRPPGAQALQDALGLLEAQAEFDGAQREVHVRVAGHDGAIYVDLANDSWEAVEIKAGSWQVVSSAATPVRFRRPRGMLPLPVPVRGRTVDELRRFVNVSDDGAWRLLVAWLVQALRPSGPYPVLLLQGEQGSAKSTAERLLRALVDPSTAPLRTTPRNEHDLYIAATSAWVIALDNISNLPPWLSDAFCRLATGGGFSTRTLYENREQELFDATRPVAINGITDVATRPDLIDRALSVSLPPIPENERKPEAELWADFEKARPSILGALFDAVAGALAGVSSLRLEGMPRMADFALWAAAAEGALGWESGSFIKAYVGNREEANEATLEADPVAGAVRELMKDRDEWSGTATQLWKELGDLVGEEIRHTNAWPGAPNALSARLKRLAPSLRGVGIEYEEVQEAGSKSRKKKVLRKLPKLTNATDATDAEKVSKVESGVDGVDDSSVFSKSGSTSL